MSRVGRKPITIPEKVTVDVKGQNITVKGPKGELSHTLPEEVGVNIDNGTLTIVRANDQSRSRALHGLTRALVYNMVTGVSEGFVKSLTVTGVGYNGEVRGKNLVMKLGYSHEIVVEPRENISFEVQRENPTIFHVRVRGIDKQRVGQTAAEIRELRPPEPYLGKGVRYSNEVIRRKAGKAGKGK
jgi:large subunit ribosomal protein L6